MLWLSAWLALASPMGTWQSLAVDDDEIARHIGEIDLVHDRDGRVHVVWTATRMEQGVDHLGNQRWWRARRLHTVFRPGRGWSEPVDLGHGYARPQLAAAPDGSVVLLATGYNQDPKPDRFGTPPGDGQASWRTWRAGQGWGRERALLDDTPRLLHGASVLGTAEGVRVAWAPWDGDGERIHVAELGPRGVVDERVLPGLPDGDLTHPAWTISRTGPQLYALAQGTNRHLPWVVQLDRPTLPTLDVGTPSERWNLVPSRIPGDWSVAWLSVGWPDQVHLLGPEGLGALTLVEPSQVRLALAGDLLLLGTGNSVLLFRSGEEGSWQHIDLQWPRSRTEIRGVALGVHDGQVVVVAAGHGDEGDEVVAWQASLEELRWLPAPWAAAEKPRARVTR